MPTAPFDFASLLKPGLPPAAVRFAGFPKYNFVGGHNDPESTPVEDLVAAATAVIRREGRTLATYGLNSGPQGYIGLREFLARKLGAHAGIKCTADDILMTSGSNHAIDLINGVLVGQGDTVIIEEDNYGSVITRLNRIGAKIVGIPLDRHGMRMDALSDALAGLKSKGVRPKYIYTIPTVQNPTATILPVERREQLLRLAQEHAVPIFEDDCYSDLVFSGQRPPAIKGMSDWSGIIHIGSFSKSIAPALRSGFVVAHWDVMSRMLGIKTDGGTAALEQMVLAEYCTKHFDAHIKKLQGVLKDKAETMMEALAEQFGTAAEFERPEGGIFLWVKLPAEVDTTKLFQVAGKAGVAINPGPEWSVSSPRNKRQLRLCFGYPTKDAIRAGVAALAEVCHKEMGVPKTIANVKR